MSKIRVCCMKEEAIEALKTNSAKITEILKSNPDDASFLREIYTGKLYDEKKFTIPEFTLKVDGNGNYSNVEYENAITLYENLKDLPRYILCNEGFWMWLEFEITFKASLQAMPMQSNSTFLNMWTFAQKTNKGFTQNVRRGIFFNVMSRTFFRVFLTEDNRLEDKYELTKFIYKFIYRFREYTWRINSDNKNIILPAIKAEKDFIKNYSNSDSNEKQDFESQVFYAELAKQLSLYGSVKLPDAVDEKDIYDYIIKKMETMVNK